jgi:hypothetical protein
MELLMFLLMVLLVDLAALKWGLTAEKAGIVLNGTNAGIFLSQQEPDDQAGGVLNPPGLAKPTICNGTFQRKGRAMNTPIQTPEQLTGATHAEAVASEIDKLAQSSFTAEEIAALLWLRRWYQSGGSDRVELVRSFEFLKWLVMTGKLAV